MGHNAALVFEAISVFATAASIAYFGLCIVSAVGFLRGRTAAKENAFNEETQMPAVSILKPLKGTDPQMYENFRSHCLQNYPEFEIIFGVSEPDDPALALVEQLKAEFPQIRITVLVCRDDLGANIKVSNLAQMLAQAQHQYLVVNDSDIRVAPDYLQKIIPPLLDSKVGLVTCLYRGVVTAGLGARLEALSIATDFCAGVLAAKLIEGGTHFGLGSTLAFRRSDLRAIGGFEGLADYLADDYEIGSRVAKLGLEVRLSSEVVETLLPAYTLRSFIDHQLRWARTIRSSRRWGYLGIVLTFAFPWALLALLSAHGARWAWELLALALGIRLAAAWLIGRNVLQDSQTISFLWLVPLRDVIAVFVWLGGLAGRTVKWRGKVFELKNGKLSRTART